MIKRFIGAAALAAAISLGGTAVAAQAAPVAQVQQAKKSTCDSRYVCFYPSPNEVGPVSEFSAVGLPNQWLTIPSNDKPGSVWNNTGSSVELWNAQTGAQHCVFAGDSLNLNNSWGHFYINYGHTSSCVGVPNYN